MGTDITIILLLMAANGLFAMTEIAVVSARKTRLRALAEEGDEKAQAALELQEQPTRFLSTVQLGITIVGTLAAAFGGATIAEKIEAWAISVPFLASWARPLSLTLVVVPLCVLELLVGELVPKRLALAFPEAIARFAARPMQRLSRLCGPLVTALGVSSDFILRLFGIRGEKSDPPTEEEVVALVEQGREAGVFKPEESEMVENVLELDTLPVKALMTPRPKMVFISADDPPDLVWHKIVVSGHSRYPVYEGNRDNVIGVIEVKAIFANLAIGVPAVVRDLMTKPLVVPETQLAIQLLDTLRQHRSHFALVADEFGGISGLITLEDVMQAVLGDFPTAHQRLQPEARRRPDGTWLVDGMYDLDALEEKLPELEFPTATERDYQTLGGLVVANLAHVPNEGETFVLQGWRFEIIDMDRHRVDKVLLTKLPTVAA